VAIVANVLLGWLSWDAAAFLAAGAFTFAVAVVMAFDAAVDWFDPQEEGGRLPRRFQTDWAWWAWLERAAPTWLKVIGIPACFIAGCFVGHLLWH
jgi:hypothetical protein